MELSTDFAPANAPQVIFPSWPIASHYQSFMPLQLKSPVRSSPHPSFLEPVRCRCFRECSAGDICVLANCQELAVFNTNDCREFTGKTNDGRVISGNKFPAPFFLKKPADNVSSNVPQVMFLFWPIASCYHFLVQRIQK